MSELECNLQVGQSQSQWQSISGPRIEFEVVLPYSLDEFTEVVQDNFKIAVAAAASAGCTGTSVTCNITKTEVVITRVKDNAPTPGARRGLYAAAGITVGVGIKVLDTQAGQLMVGALTMDAINTELTKQGVQQITKVTSRPELFSSASNNQTSTGVNGVERGLDPAQLAGIIVGIILGMIVLVAIALFYRRKHVRVSPTGADGPTVEVDTDYDDLKEKLKEACRELNLFFSDDQQHTGLSSGSSLFRFPQLNSRSDQPSSKFKMKELVFGQPSSAAEGIFSLLCVEDTDMYNELGDPLNALDKEIDQNGTPEDKECYDYVKNQEAGSNNKTFQEGWKRDCDRVTGKVLPERQVDDSTRPGGKRGMTLADFANSKMAKLCKLTKAEVLALRFYTTAGYKTMNNFLRDEGRHEREEQHPLPVMVFLLYTAVKKLRTKASKSSSGLKWKRVTTKPSKGVELKNPALETALRTKTATFLRPATFLPIQEIEFTQQEFDGFGISDLSMDNFIKLSNSYFTPHESSKTANQNKDLFRGMSNVELQSSFVQHGGTELAPMSTTEDIKIAIQYGATGLQAILLRVRTTGFMNLGAELKWLSAFPFEEELLYPPATYLKPWPKGQPPKPRVFKMGNTIFLVIDVEPQLS